MAGTADGSGQRQPPVRASDAEREEAVAGLRERFAAGHLSQDTFVARMGAALGARDRRDLADLFADLPAPRRHRGAAWSGLAELPPRLAAAVSPVKDAMITSARWVSAPCRGRVRPDCAFPSAARSGSPSAGTRTATW